MTNEERFSRLYESNRELIYELGIVTGKYEALLNSCAHALDPATVAKRKNYLVRVRHFIKATEDACRLLRNKK